MNKKDLNEIEIIFNKEIKKARYEQEISKPFDQQYYIGREHAAKDILLEMYSIYRRNLIKKYDKGAPKK